MIAEKIFAQYNIAEILESIAPLMEKYKPVQRSRAVGGWALQSTNGSYTDGWTMDFCPYNGPNNIGPTWTPKNDNEENMNSIQSFIKDTELSTEPIKNLLKKITELGLNPRRARIIKLASNSSADWHIDGSKKFYQVRLHIPLITNEKCFFETEGGQYHMAADGSFYFVHINRRHRIFNTGDTDRLHFVTHVWDKKKITAHHQYDLEKNLGESPHP